jgi:ribonuclease G
MIKDMIVSSTALETRVAILEDDQLAELYIERHGNRGILSNTYKGRVTKVLPGMQSAFVNIGLEKDAFLYVSDFVEESEECETVFPVPEEPADAAPEPETQERQGRRERKGERGRWRDRRERSEPRTEAGETVDVSEASEAVEAASEAPLERWNISAETDRETEGHFEADVLTGASAPPVFPVEPEEGGPGAAEAPEGGAPSPEPAPGEPSPEPPPADAAAIRDDGETLPFAAEEGSKPGFVRRRGQATRRKRYTAARHSLRAEHQSIDDMLHEGQEVLVQVAKEPIGKKGARVTSHIALPGRYLVYMPTVEHIGVSRKIGSDAERLRLKEILLKHRDRFPGGVIVRTAAAEHSEEDLVNDLNFLVRLWEDMRTRAEKVSAPALVHAEMSLVQRLLRDQFSFEFASIRVDDELEYQRVVSSSTRSSRTWCTG